MVRRSFSRLTLVGIFLLAVGNIFSYIVQRHSSLPEATADPIIGFVYGVAIATTLLGVWKQGRRGPIGCS